MATRSSVGARIALAVAVFVLAAVPWAARARAQGSRANQDAPAEQAENQRRQAELAAEIDLLRADDAAVGRALDAVNTELAAQIDRAKAAAAAADQARRDVESARATEAEVAAEVKEMEVYARDLALALYLRPPSESAVVFLAGENLIESPRQVALVRFRAEDTVVAARQLRVLRNQMTEATLAAELAQSAADDAANTEYQRLVAMREAKTRQETFAVGVGDRIERAIREAETLKGRNAAIAAQIQSDQAALVDKLRGAPQIPTELSDRPVPPPGSAGGTASEGSTPSSATPATAARPSPPTQPPNTAPPAAPPTPQTSPPTAPPVTEAPAVPPTTGPEPVEPPPTTQPEAPPSTTPPSSGGSSGQSCASLGLSVDTTWASGIEVNVSVAGQVEAMVSAAAAEGVQLVGNGYRSCESQVQIRREVCGTTDYDIWERPSWECSPPVARPGRSMHEKGLAIDFFDPRTNDLIRSHDTPEWQWLSRNASRFGFANLPVEPWHWSTTGG